MQLLVTFSYVATQKTCFLLVGKLFQFCLDFLQGSIRNNSIFHLLELFWWCPKILLVILVFRYLKKMSIFETFFYHGTIGTCQSNIIQVNWFSCNCFQISVAIRHAKEEINCHEDDTINVSLKGTGPSISIFCQANL